MRGADRLHAAFSAVNGRCDPRLSGVATVVGAVAGSVACALVLHGVASRAHAAAIVPIAIAWGLLCSGLVRRGPTAPLAVAAVALLVRLPLIGTPPHLSDDVYRYLWEGLALHHGHNPFLEAPATISGLDDALRDRVNHGGIPSIYPPVALLWFRALAALGHVWTAQLAAALVDAAIAGSLAWTRLGRDLQPWPAMVYALHPLPVLESASGAHLEPVAVLLAILAVRWSDADRPAGAVGLATLGVGAKLFPVVLLPTLLLGRPRLPRALGLVGGIALLVLLAWPVLDAGPALLDAFRTYGAHWAFNGFAHRWLAPWLGLATRPVLVAIAAGVTLAAVARSRDPAVVWLVAGSAFVLLSPTAHPWYVVWALVPALILGRTGWAWAASFLVGSYAVLVGWDAATGSWSEPAWLWWITWPPAVAALLGATWREDQRRTAPSPTAR